MFTKGAISPSELLVVENQLHLSQPPNAAGGSTRFPAPNPDFEAINAGIGLLNLQPQAPAVIHPPPSHHWLHLSQPLNAAGGSTTFPTSNPDFEAINAGIGLLNLQPQASAVINPPPSHLRQCGYGERYRISQAVQTEYPPFPGGVGDRCWVVVIRGRDIGVFYEHWYVFFFIFSRLTYVL
jgi:hypothetical protein